MNKNNFYNKVIAVVSIFLITAIQYAYSQDFTGRVIDIEGNAISYATVLISADTLQTMQPKAYGTTDHNGDFYIKAKNIIATDWVIIRCLGYKEQLHRYETLCCPTTITLNEDYQNLDEVVVRAQYSGVKFANDTVKYDTNHFRTGNETNIGEVLNRMPGIDVSSSGKVSYAGKNITKILVDGKDIFSTGNNLLINTLSADAMSGAEVLTNYHDGSIFEPYQTNETLALNIRTNNDKRISGNIDALGGLFNKFSAKSTLLSITEKISTSTLVSCNNIGVPVFSIEDYISTTVGLDNILTNNSNSITLSQEEADMLMPPKDMYKLLNGALSFNTNYTPSEAFLFKGNVLYNGSNSHALSSSIYNYIDGTTLQSDERSNQTNHFCNVSFMEKWKPSSKLQILASTNINYSNYNNRCELENFFQNKSNTYQNNRLGKYGISQDISINAGVGLGILYFNTFIDYLTQKDKLAIQTNTPLLPIDYTYETTYNYWNITNGEQLQIVPELGYVLPISEKVNLNTAIIAKYVTEDLECNPIGKEKINWENLLLSVSLKKNEGIFNFDIGTSVGYNYYTFKDRDYHKSLLYLSPYATIQLKFNQRHKFSFMASYDMSPYRLSDISNNMRVMAYNKIYSGSNIRNPFKKELKLSSNYHIYDLFSNTFFIAIVGYNETYNAPRSSSTQDGIVNYIGYVDGGRINHLYTKLNLSKGFGFLPIKSKLTFDYNFLSNDLYIMQLYDKITHNQINTGISLVSNFKFPLNGEISVNYVYENSLLQNLNVVNVANEWQATAKLMFAHNNINGTLYGSLIQMTNSMYNKNIVDLGFSLEYKIKQFNIMLQGANLLNLRNLDWLETNMTSSYIKHTTYRQMPGYILFGLGYTL